MAKYEHGSMNTETQEKTFEGFMRWTVNSVIVILAVIIFMAIFLTF